MKIIHIVENLDKGAVENWLVNVFIESRKKRPEWEWTFYCILGKEGRLDDKVKNAGGKIIYSPVAVSSKLAFLKSLRNVLKKGRYDVLHAHHDYLSGFYLLASAGIRFKKRFLHIHNTDKALPVGNKTVHNILLKPFRQLALILSDQVIGISQHTLEEFAERKNVPDNKFIILYYGVNFDCFEPEVDKNAMLEDFKLPANSKVLLYAGRLNQLKNPVYVVEVLAQLAGKRDDVYAVFIGQGGEQAVIQQKAEQLGITDRIRIYGWHNNVAAVMKVADVFVFPRKPFPKEGLGLVVIEAQAAGLPMFITHGIADDAIVIAELAHFNNLNEPSVWAQQIEDVINSGVSISRSEALKKMRRSPFELSTATKNLVDIYER